MTQYGFDISEPEGPRFGLVVLQADETIEDDFRRLLPGGSRLLVSRVPSALDVTRESLAQMETHLTAAAALFPRGVRFDAVGYGCTSGTAEIGADRIAEKVLAGACAAAVTEPLSALVAACEAQGIRRVGLLSPYVAEVSDRLRGRLAERGVETPVFGSFDEAEEARVARIDGPSILAAGRALAVRGGIEGMFLSCTNLRTLDVIPELEDATGLPVLSSNLVLAWDMLRLAGAAPDVPGRLLRGG